MTAESYRDHVQELQRRTEEALSVTGFEGLVIHSGTPFRYFADDEDAPFHPTPHFAHWLPLRTPWNLLVIRPGERPLLINFAPEDYWYEKLPLGNPYWAEPFEIKSVGKADQVWEELPKNGRYAFHGDCPELAGENGFAKDVINSEELVARLDWNRSYKTGYEVDCIDEASKLGAVAHKAAREAFESGASELDTHYAYVQALELTDNDLPYPSIVAFDSKGAILHYHNKKQREGHVLLIDCGAAHQGYASDITRTWTKPSCDSLFREMVERFDAMEKTLCADVKPGLGFPELHHTAHVRIGDLLHEAGVLKVAGEEAAGKGLTRPFFPHGLGHFLGIQVHDVAGHQKEPAGGTNTPPERYPFLRTTRAIEEHQVFTVEPGLYFIEMLLRDHREGENKDLFDWDLIERLAPFGGMRIEDNVVVTKDGHRNLTREYLP